MEIKGRSLTFNGISIKAKEGSISDNLLSFSEKDSVVYVGNLKFPLARYNKFDPDSNGFLKVESNYLILTYNYEQFTLNTVTFKTEKNEGEGQQATFTVQNGDQSFILTNAVEQEQTVKWTGQQITVTAINYATGAIDSKTVTPQPGQVYRLSSTSESHEEGELKTVGGELISGGELKTVCVQEGYDLDNANIAYNGMTTTPLSNTGEATMGSVISANSPAVHTKMYSTEQEAINDFMNLYVNVMSSTDSNSVSTQLKKYQDIAASPLYLIKPIEPAEEVIPGTITVLKDLGNYSLVRRHTSGDYNIISFGNSMGNNIMALSLDTAINTRLVLERGQQVNVLTTDGSTTRYRSNVGYEIQIINNILIKDEIQKVCLQSENIDTRYSYTTPVVTTDTRRTVNTISLTVSELN